MASEVKVNLTPTRQLNESDREAERPRVDWLRRGSVMLVTGQ